MEEEIDIDAGVDDFPAGEPKEASSSRHARISAPTSGQREGGRGTNRRKPELTIDDGRGGTVSSGAVDAVYRGLGVDPSLHLLDTVMIKGCDGMQSYQIEKMFAACPVLRTIALEDKSSFVVQFRGRSDASAMMVRQTKRLIRKRSKLAQEEGEAWSDEEEGELQAMDGDDVAVEDGVVAEKTVKDESVEVNVDELSLPSGRWRVVSAHVPNSRLILVRFATRDELENALNTGKIFSDKKKKRYVDEEVYEEPLRPGLNIFDSENKELEWDYEHDTRFYEDLDAGEDEAKEDEGAMAGWPSGDSNKKVRGRGAKSARFNLGESSMKSEIVTKQPAKLKAPTTSRTLASRVTGGVFDDNSTEIEEDEDGRWPTGRNVEEDEEDDRPPRASRGNLRITSGFDSSRLLSEGRKSVFDRVQGGPRK